MGPRGGIRALAPRVTQQEPPTPWGDTGEPGPGAGLRIWGLTGLSTPAHTVAAESRPRRQTRALLTCNPSTVPSCGASCLGQPPKPPRAEKEICFVSYRLGADTAGSSVALLGP